MRIVYLSFFFLRFFPARDAYSFVSQLYHCRRNTSRCTSLSPTILITNITPCYLFLYLHREQAIAASWPIRIRFALPFIEITCFSLLCSPCRCCFSIEYFIPIFALIYTPRSRFVSTWVYWTELSKSCDHFFPRLTFHACRTGSSFAIWLPRLFLKIVR